MNRTFLPSFSQDAACAVEEVLKAAATAHKWQPAVTETSGILSARQTDRHIALTVAY